MAFFTQMVTNGLLTGGVYALMALAVVVVWKSSSVFNFAHGSLVGVTTFMIWQLTIAWQIPLWLALPMQLGIISLLSFLIQRLVLQRLTGQSVLSAVIATLALGQLFAGVAVLFWPGEGRTLPTLVAASKIRLGSSWVIASESLANFVVCGICFAIFLIFFQKTRLGLAMRGTAEDHTLAQSEGIKVSLIFILSWIVAILVAFIGGRLMSSLYGVSFGILNDLGMKALAVVILGGMESITGALLGALIIGVAEALSSGYIDPYVGGGSSDVAPYIVMLIVLIFKPYGLFGYEKIERV